MKIENSPEFKRLYGKYNKLLDSQINYLNEISWDFGTRIIDFSENGFRTLERRKKKLELEQNICSNLELEET